MDSLGNMYSAQTITALCPELGRLAVIFGYARTRSVGTRLKKQRFAAIKSGGQYYLSLTDHKYIIAISSIYHSQHVCSKRRCPCKSQVVLHIMCVFYAQMQNILLCSLVRTKPVIFQEQLLVLARTACSRESSACLTHPFRFSTPARTLARTRNDCIRKAINLNKEKAQ